MAGSDDKLLDTSQAAKLMKLSASTLNQWRCYRCGPPFVRVGRMIRYRIADLRTWLDSRTVEAEEE